MKCLHAPLKMSRNQGGKRFLYSMFVVSATVALTWYVLQFATTPFGSLPLADLDNLEISAFHDIDSWTPENISQISPCSSSSSKHDQHIGIPRFLHQSYKTKEIGQKWRFYRDTWRQLNPQWRYLFWTDDDNAAILQRFYPEYEDVYKLFPGIMQADFARLMYMDLCGGVYADLDFMALRPLETYAMIEYRNISIIGSMGTNPAFTHALPNALLMSTPRHPLWRHCMNMAATRARSLLNLNVHIETNKIHVETLTGPVLLHDCILDFTGHTETRPVADLFKPSLGKRMKDFLGLSVFEKSKYIPQTGFQPTNKEHFHLYIAPWLDFYPRCWKPKYRSKGELYMRFKCGWCLSKHYVDWLPQVIRCGKVLRDAGSYAVTFWDHSWA